jgi:hypothetical protein
MAAGMSALSVERQHDEVEGSLRARRASGRARPTRLYRGGRDRVVVAPARSGALPAPVPPPARCASAHAPLTRRVCQCPCSSDQTRVGSGWSRMFITAPTASAVPTRMTNTRSRRPGLRAELCAPSQHRLYFSPLPQGQGSLRACDIRHDLPRIAIASSLPRDSGSGNHKDRLRSHPWEGV